MLLEIACFNPVSAQTACSAGADRIELCNNQHLGGTSPPLEWVQQVKRVVSTPIFVMIRPRGGDFYYSVSEFESMQADIAQFKPYVDGFVFGILSEDRRVDVLRTADLVQRASPLPCTFHRAFDEVADVEQALEDIAQTGCRTILSSGGAQNASQGKETLARLVQLAAGRIVLMPGGGVRASNLAGLCWSTRASAFHSAATPSGGEHADPSEIQAMKQILCADPRG
jgi:copper homeostasis protein